MDVAAGVGELSLKERLVVMPKQPFISIPLDIGDYKTADAICLAGGSLYGLRVVQG